MHISQQVLFFSSFFFFFLLSVAPFRVERVEQAVSAEWRRRLHRLGVRRIENLKLIQRLVFLLLLLSSLFNVPLRPSKNTGEDFIINYQPHSLTTKRTNRETCFSTIFEEREFFSSLSFSESAQEISYQQWSKVEQNVKPEFNKQLNVGDALQVTRWNIVKII